MSLKTYDPKQVAVIVGSRALTGLADGEFVSVERNADSWVRTTGIHGEVTRAKQNDKSGRITLTLMAASVDNGYMSDLHTTDELGGAGTFAVTIRDASGNDLHVAATAWIVKPATAAYAKDASGTRQWVIETDELVTYMGGN